MYELYIGSGAAVAVIATGVYTRVTVSIRHVAAILNPSNQSAG